MELSFQKRKIFYQISVILKKYVTKIGKQPKMLKGKKGN